MGYLSEFEHDIFVSYAHSDLLNDWSRRLIDELRKRVAGGLGLRCAEQVGLWWDYELRGNKPLTNQLRGHVEGAGVLLALMSDWYLDSAWCRDERDWFLQDVRRRGDDRVFVVRVRVTDDGCWPEVFKDERGHPLVGYDFVRSADASYPKGYPNPENASDSKEYYAELDKLARDIISQLKALKRVKFMLRSSPTHTGPIAPREQVFLAAVPEEIDELRQELTDLLRKSGCAVVPETNPLDLDDIHVRAPDWIAKCTKFVQVLGNHVGRWRHDEAGFVVYQHKLARQSGKPIFVYRGPSLEITQIKQPEYRELLERMDQDDTGSLENFAQRVVRFVGSASNNADACQCVYMMATERDQDLEREVRRLLKELEIDVYPLPRRGQNGREVLSVLNEGKGFLDVVKRCRAILLINGNVKENDLLWIDGRVADIEFDLAPKLGGHPPYAIVDAPPDPRLERLDLPVFFADSPTFEDELRGWLGR